MDKNVFIWGGAMFSSNMFLNPINLWQLLVSDHRVLASRNIHVHPWWILSSLLRADHPVKLRIPKMLASFSFSFNHQGSGFVKLPPNVDFAVLPNAAVLTATLASILWLPFIPFKPTPKRHPQQKIHPIRGCGHLPRPDFSFLWSYMNALALDCFYTYYAQLYVYRHIRIC